MEQSEIIKAARFSIRNREQIKASEMVGCYYCLEIYPSRYLKEEDFNCDGGRTALCQFCGIDSVLGDASPYLIEKDTLKVLNEHWFGTKK